MAPSSTGNGMYYFLSTAAERNDNDKTKLFPPPILNWPKV